MLGPPSASQSAPPLPFLTSSQQSSDACLFGWLCVFVQAHAWHHRRLLPKGAVLACMVYASAKARQTTPLQKELPDAYPDSHFSRMLWFSCLAVTTPLP